MQILKVSNPIIIIVLQYNAYILYISIAIIINTITLRRMFINKINTKKYIYYGFTFFILLEKFY